MPRHYPAGNKDYSAPQSSSKDRTGKPMANANAAPIDKGVGSRANGRFKPQSKGQTYGQEAPANAASVSSKTRSMAKHKYKPQSEGQTYGQYRQANANSTADNVRDKAKAARPANPSDRRKASKMKALQMMRGTANTGMY
jgi:hypothetical protein